MRFYFQISLFYVRVGVCAYLSRIHMYQVKTLGDLKVEPETLGDLGEGAVVAQHFGWKFFILISLFLSDHLHVQKVRKVNSPSFILYMRCDDIN